MLTADQDAKALARCRHIICVTAATSGFQWQCYVPTLALLITKDLGREITDVDLHRTVSPGSESTGCGCVRREILYRRESGERQNMRVRGELWAMMQHVCVDNDCVRNREL